MPCGHHAAEVAVRRGDDAHVDGLLARAADGAHGLLLQRAEEARLHLRSASRRSRRGGSCPPSASRKRPFRSRSAPGERAAHVAEELALEEVRRDRAAVDADEGLLRARARVVDGVGDHLLARPALARDEHGDVGVLHPIDERVELAHRRARADEARVAEVAA